MTKTILLTRPEVYNDKDIIFFETLGYQCIQLPLLEVLPRQLTVSQQQIIQQAQWLLFTSQAAIEPLLPFIQPHSKIAAIGASTAQRLRDYHLNVDFVSTIETKKAMLSQWLKLKPQGLIVYGKSQLANDYIVQQLSKQGMQCYEFIVYDNLFTQQNQNLLKVLLQKKQVDTVYFTSPSAWRRFYRIYQYYPQSLSFISLGTTTQQAIAAQGYYSILKSELL